MEFPLAETATIYDVAIIGIGPGGASAAAEAQVAGLRYVGIERGKAKIAGEEVAFEDRVTNVYRRESGTWKIVHHHTDISAPMMEILKRLQAKK